MFERGEQKQKIEKETLCDLKKKKKKLFERGERKLREENKNKKIEKETLCDLKKKKKNCQRGTGEWGRGKKTGFFLSSRTPSSNFAPKFSAYTN
jgi:hypothetical protein